MYRQQTWLALRNIHKMFYLTDIAMVATTSFNNATSDLDIANMKTLFNILSYILKVVAGFVFASGIILVIFGGYHFVNVFRQLGGEEVVVGLMATSLLRTIVYFLLAIVFFVFSLGVLVLFTNKPERDLPNNFPVWLRIKNFMQLKVILWEAILTTLVVLYLASLVEKGLKGIHVGYLDLVVPGSIALLAISIFLLKKGEH